MALKIEKIWGSVFSPNAVKRKESAPKDEHSQPEQKNKEKNEESPAEQQQADRQSVEKAMLELKSEQGFNAGGLSVEMKEQTSGQITVSFKESDGHIVRTMSGEEFLKLRSAATDKARGKILDQKF